MSSEPRGARPSHEPSGWQAQKSAATRQRIVEAAVRCLVELGYAHTTTTAIAGRAGLSRGAMLHHFPAKLEVVGAAIEHLYARRLQAFRKSLERAPPGGDRLREGLAGYFGQVRQPLFVALFELAVAARTDRELAAILQPAQQAFEREWQRAARELVGDGGARGEDFELALDLSRCVMEGMAASVLAHRDSERERRLLGYLESRLRELLAAPAR